MIHQNNPMPYKPEVDEPNGLDEILSNISDVTSSQFVKTRDEAAAAIRSAIQSAIPEKIETEPLGMFPPTDLMVCADQAYNKAIDQITTELTKRGLL